MMDKLKTRGRKRTIYRECFEFGEAPLPDDPSTYIPVVTLNADELRRFQQNAPAALAARGAGFVRERLTQVGETLLTGLVPLVGVLADDWPFEAMVVFLLVGIWTAILGDLIKYVVLRKAVRGESREREKHRRVWLVVDALRKQQSEARAILAKYPPGVGLFIDMALGSIATLTLVMGLIESEEQNLNATFRDLSFVLSLLGFVAFELVLAVASILRHRLGGGDQHPVRIDAGMRGVGLFLLLALTLCISQLTGAPPRDQVSARVIVLTQNVWFVLLGLGYGLNLIRMLRQAGWLRQYLRQEHQIPDRSAKRHR